MTTKKINTEIEQSEETKIQNTKGIIQEQTDKQKEISDTLLFSEVIDSIKIDISDRHLDTFDYNEEFKKKFGELLKNLSNEQLHQLKGLHIVCAERTIGSEPTECKGIDMAMEKFRENPNRKIVIVSFLDEKTVSEFRSDVFGYLMSKPNTAFIRLPFTPQNMFDLISSEFLGVDVKLEETEEEFQKLIEREVNHFLHNTSRFTNIINLHGKTYEEQLPILFNISENEKPQDLLDFENKLIDFLQIQHPSFKLLPRKNNRQGIVDTYKYIRMKTLPEGTRFEGVFVDRDGCIYDNKNLKFNQSVIDMIKEYERQGKLITLWTQGNLEMKQQLLDEAGLNYKIENKTDYKGGTVEIAIDNDPQEFLLANAKIKSEKHIKV